MKVLRWPLKMHHDERGGLIYPECPEITSKIKHFVVSISPPGAVRGNHYHKTRTEWISIIQGKAELHLIDLNSQERASLLLNGGTPELVEIPPRVALVIKNVGEGEMIFLGFFDAPFDSQHPDDGTYQVLDIDK